MATPGEKPMAFAVMRNAHEAFRMCFRVLEKYLEPSGDRNEFLSVFNDFLKSMTVHMLIEDVDMFGLLNEISGGQVEREGTFQLHSEDEKLLNEAKRLLPAATASDVEWAAFREAFLKWTHSHNEHFLKEEALLLPLTPKTAPTPEGRSRVVHDRIILPALARDREAFHFHIAFSVHYLSKYGSTSQDAFKATQVYLRGLKSSLTAEEWSSEFVSLCRKACVPEIWSQLNEQSSIESLEVDILQ